MNRPRACLWVRQAHMSFRVLEIIENHLSSRDDPVCHIWLSRGYVGSNMTLETISTVASNTICHPYRDRVSLPVSTRRLPIPTRPLMSAAYSWRLFHSSPARTLLKWTTSQSNGTSRSRRCRTKPRPRSQRASGDRSSRTAASPATDGPEAS